MGIPIRKISNPVLLEKHKHFEELRRRAENMLSSAALDTDQNRFEDVRELLHKLNVYQIELEIQNDELLSLQHELETSRNKYVKLYDFAPAGYFTFDRDGLILEANLTGAQLLGVNRNYLHKKPFMTYLASDNQKTFFSHRERAFLTRLPQQDELKIISRDGFEHEVQIQSIVIPAEGAEPGETLCFSAVVDVTERKRIERELARAKEEAEAANKAKSDFLARMSHELRTPLHGILGMTEVTLETALGDEQRRYLDMVRQSAQSLLSIVNDILDISKVEVGVLQLEERIFDLRDMIEGGLGALEVQAKKKGLSFTFELAPDLPIKVVGDPVRLKQVLINLVGNAVKFTREGGVTVRARSLERNYGALDGKAAVEFTVEDSGVGIDDLNLARVFEGFYQADASVTREFEGTGLGLTIAKSLVEMMGGHIKVASSPGKGSTFVFTIRVKIDKPALQTIAVADPEAKDVEPPLPPKKILLAEDNVVNQTFAQLILQRDGHQVVTVENGLEALEALEREPFDLVLMDVRMPEMDGVTAVKRIRAPDSTVMDSDIPVIAMTAHSQKEDRERFLAAGMDDYVSKPMSRQAILQAMRNVLAPKPKV